MFGFVFIMMINALKPNNPESIGRRPSFIDGVVNTIMPRVPDNKTMIKLQKMLLRFPARRIIRTRIPRRIHPINGWRKFDMNGRKMIKIGMSRITANILGYVDFIYSL